MYIIEKDIFHKRYKELLARRLLQRRDQSLDAETAMLHLLTVSFICVSEDAGSIFNSF